MSSIWDEALGAVNAYSQRLKQDGVDAFVTLAVFDSEQRLNFDVLRKGVASAHWRDVTNDEASPRGMTPLFDAIGKIVAMAEADAPQRAVIVIMTDGAENSSREMKREDAKAALDRCEKRGWEVVFLGAEFAKFSDAEAVGVGASKRMAMARGKMGATMTSLASKSRDYFQGGASVDFNAADREEAGEEDVKQRKS
jgi:hypothetical protein